MTPANDNKTEAVDGSRLSQNTLFVVIASAIVVLTMAAAVAISDPPWVVRDLKADQALVTRLNAIQTSVSNFRRINGKLPANLSDLLASPQTTPYGATADNLKDVEYSASGDAGAYALCASFKRASGPELAYYTQSWKHEAGRQCFNLKAPEKSSQLDNTYREPG